MSEPENIGLKKSFLGKSFLYHLGYYNSPDYLYSDKKLMREHIHDFKNNNLNTPNIFAQYSALELKKLNIKFDYIVRALGSEEALPNPKHPLSTLGKLLAEHLEAAFIPEILAKKKTPKIADKNKEERARLLKNAYSLNNPQLYNLNNNNILIIDDIATTGATLNAIHNVLSSSWPKGHYQYFTLGKTLDKYDTKEKKEEAARHNGAVAKEIFACL